MNLWRDFIAAFLIHWLFVGAIWHSAAHGWVAAATYRRLFPAAWLTAAFAVALLVRAVLGT